MDKDPCERPASAAFTLIELLVVIAIIAILAVVVVLTLNPSELLKQSRDASRVSDLATLNSALNLYVTDQQGTGSFSLGAASTSYPSLFDPSATSTVDTQCQGIGVPAVSTSTGQAWACSSSTTYRSVSGLGWVPVNLTSISGGSPLGALPQDPINQSSSGLFYSYATNGIQYEVASLFESQKYRAQSIQSPQNPYYPEVNAMGSNLALSPLFNPVGLVGWWPLSEGAGTTAYDRSGNGNNGGWSGTQAGQNSTYYTAGKVGSYAGYFDGSTDTISLATTATLQPSNVSVSLWVQEPVIWANNYAEIGAQGHASCYTMILDHGNFNWNVNNGTRYSIGTSAISGGQWYFIAGTFNGSSMALYLNGQLVGTTAAGMTCSSPGFTIGHPSGVTGGSYYINDVRIYNRALSAAEIQEIYSATK